MHAILTYYFLLNFSFFPPPQSRFLLLWAHSPTWQPNLNDACFSVKCTGWAVPVLLTHINDIGYRLYSDPTFLSQNFWGSVHRTIRTTYLVFLPAALCSCCIAPVTFQGQWTQNMSPAFYHQNNVIISIAVHIPSGISVEASIVFLGQRAYALNAV